MQSKNEILRHPAVPLTASSARDPISMGEKASLQPSLSFADGGALQWDSALPATLGEALIRTAARFPNKGIVHHLLDGSEQSQSFESLLVEARRILSGLRGAGLKPGDRVILQMKDLRDHFPAFWACILGGIAPVTVSIPPTYAEKNNLVMKVFHVWETLENPTILCTGNLVPEIAEMKTLFSLNELRILGIDGLRQNEPAAEVHQAKPDDVAFFQLTSGSTGVPKCIQEVHRGVIAHIQGSSSFLGLSPDDIILNWLPMDHVVPMLMYHIKDVYLGCQEIQVKTETVLSDPLKWLDLIQRHHVTHTWAPNFGFKLVVDRLLNAKDRSWDLSSIRYFLNAGEQVTLPVVSHFLKQTAPFGVPESAMQPAFGMAELCTVMTYCKNFRASTHALSFEKSSLNGVLKLTDGENTNAANFVNVGPPIPGVQIQIAGQKNELLPEGKIGRLQVRGRVVTPGYLNNKAANDEVFVGEGWFDTGDLGFMRKGELFITGRAKEMIIIRGANYYCYEIEVVINDVPGVEPTFVAACAVEDEKTGSEGLALFFTPSVQGTEQIIEVIKKIRARATSQIGLNPLCIIPVPREQFPKTTSGKIQRVQLKKAFLAGQFEATVAQVEKHLSRKPAAEFQSEKETAVASIWEEVLGMKAPGRTDNFFELGGDSLKAIQVLSRVRERFGAELPLRSLFEEAGTIAGMVHAMEQVGPMAREAAIEPVSRTGNLRLSFPQQRIWLADQMESGTALYNVCRALWIKGPLDPAALQRSLDAIVARHEILRTTFSFQNGEPVQVVQPRTKIDLPTIDLSTVPEVSREEMVEGQARTEAKLPFDLTTGPLMRVKLYRLSATCHVLVTTFHQIVIDGGSLQVFFEELGSIYSSAVEGKGQALPKLKVQYADFAAWQREQPPSAKHEKSMAYWREKLAGAAPLLPLPKDHPVPEDTTIAGAVHRVVLKRELVNSLRVFNREQGVTLFMTLLTVFKSLLSYRAGQEDILVGSPVTGRNRVETERLIGFFVDTVVLRTRISSQETFRHCLEAVRETVLGSFSHAEVPFEKLVEELLPSRSRSHTPFFQVWFGFIDRQTPFQLGTGRAEPSSISPSTAQFSFSLFVSEKAEEVVCLFEYKTELFEAATIHQFANDFQQLAEICLANPSQPLHESFAQLVKVKKADSSKASIADSLKTARRKPILLNALKN